MTLAVVVLLVVGVRLRSTEAATPIPPGAKNAPTEQAIPTLVAYWTQLVGGGQVAARAILTPAGNCPSLFTGTGAAAMTNRASGKHHFLDGLGLPLVCEAFVPSSAPTATIAGQPLALPDGTASKIVVIGDTGCRIDGSKQQACNDPSTTPT